MLDTLRHSYAQFRLHYPIYFFHHLPKCGGTSVRTALDQWFQVNDDYYDKSASNTSPVIDTRTLSCLNCVSGHFGHQGYFLDQRYPQIFSGYRASKRYRAFMFMREPLKMRCSLYRHNIKNKEPTEADLASAIMPSNNYYSRIINVNEENWQERIDQYFFVGIADDFQASFDVLAYLIDKPALMLPKTNTTQRDYASSIESLTVEQVERFRSANTLDYKIYNHVLQKFELQKQGWQDSRKQQ